MNPIRPSFMSDNYVPEKGTYRCPYCGTMATLTPLAFTTEHMIYQCDNTSCQKSFYARVNYKGKTVSINHNEPSILSFEIIETYPKYVPQKHESIPQKIWADYIEACKAYDVGALKSSVVMCRRTLQSVCLERIGTKVDGNGKYIKLKDQIKQAFPQKDYSLIHAYADKIKYFGDYGAHPNDDNIDDVTKESAKACLDFTYQVLNIGFIVPWSLQSLKLS
jgi:hypothetical protein